MIRSVLKLTPADMQKLFSMLPKHAEKPKLSKNEIEKLVELKEVLELFEEFTKQMESDSVSISKVYPAVSGLKV